MKKICKVRWGLFSLLFCLVPMFANGQEKAFTVKDTFDHSDQVYKCGESARFSFEVLDPAGKPVQAGKLSVVFSNDNRDEISKKTADLSKGNPAVFTEKMDKPGFLYAHGRVDIPAVKDPVYFQAAAGFDPLKIEPGQPKPADFDSFLAEGQKEVRAIPADVKMEIISSLSNEKREIYTISFATVNNQRVYGFLGIPKFTKGPFPVVINVPGAGPGTGPLTWLTDRGFLTLAMNVFPYPVPLDPNEKKKVYDEFNKDIRYTYMGAKDRRTYFFRAAYLGIDRAIDWLVNRADADKARVGFFGTSQGGASALILTGMNKNIKYAVSSVPALCDHAGFLKGRSSGWPNIAGFFKEDPKVVAESSYLDAVNYATLITCPIKVTVGFIDRTCSPSSVYAAYNSIPSKNKQILHEVKLGHKTGKSTTDAQNWLFDTLLAPVQKDNSVKSGSTVNPATQEADRNCDRFRKQSERMAQGNVDLLMIGDSITHGWEGSGKDVWQKYYGKRNAMNFGIGGDQTQHVLWRLAHSPLDKISPKMSVVMIGTNNIGRPDRCAPEQTVEGICKIVSVLKDKYPKMKILLLEVFPRDEKADGERRIKVNKINEGLRAVYKGGKVENVQLYGIGDLFLEKDGTLPKSLMPDFLHPNAKGYEIWASAMEPMIAEVVDPAPKECVGVPKLNPKHKDWWMGRFNQKNTDLKKGDTEILMVGDSITHGWEGSGKQVWDKYYGSKKAINLGIGGDQTQHVIWRLEHYDFSKINAKLAVLLIGVNNAASGSTAANIAMGNRKICKILHEKFPQMKVLVLNVFPWGKKGENKMEKIQKINALLPYYVRDLDWVKLVDINSVFLNDKGELTPEIMPDYLHPNAKGYEKWGSALDPEISTLAP
ncbi:MAG: GDSL-type esterase/lipase family protein [Planctomycetia bacterium]|nr:GDSL-type esterase/lipase family protein [Planctomycetia bacterium]